MSMTTANSLPANSLGQLLRPLHYLYNRRNDQVRDHLYQAYQDTVARAEADPGNEQLVRQVASLARALKKYDQQR